MTRFTIKRQKELRRGFTIVELLIVVVVIAILAAITIVSYNGIQQQARRSAQLTELGQIQRQIQVGALEHDGSTVEVGVPVGINTEPGKEIDLAQSYSGQELTLYAVFDTVGALGADYTQIAILKPSGDNNRAFLRYGTGTGVGARVDTNVQANMTEHMGNGIRATTGRHVGWITTQPDGFYVGFDNDTAPKHVISPHDPFSFTGLELVSSTRGRAALVFPEYHNEQQRAAVLRYLDKKYTIDHYDS